MAKNKNLKTYFLLTISLLILCLVLVRATLAEELPRPTYKNAVIISLEHNPLDSTEVKYIKNNFNFGLYAWLSFSVTHLAPKLEWHSNWKEASEGIKSFKDSVNSLLTAARAENVGLHLVLCSGLARGLSVYREAKEEDIRNCQWYNDNKLASDDQIKTSEVMDTYIFGTLSRYARKMRANLEAKAKASLAFLKQKMDENPETFMALSGWGEVELNYNRIDHSKSLQDWFCDYSPFAVLEFRDWIQHAFFYDPINGKYKNQGYKEGGAKYQGVEGLARFNADFGTNFTTWDLKYFHWSLEDDYDQNPEDNVNNDPHRIPFTMYLHGNMMPTSGPHYIAGGFDPPRVMKRKGESKFWDLWNLFRETMVHNFVLDMAKWAEEAGLDPERWYSHQIPGDYLFGTNPAMPDKNPRYYTSASPLCTANIVPFGSLGATIYDVKFPASLYPPEFARTTQYILPDISAMSGNWAVMEYDAEAYPPGLGVVESSPEVILEQFMRIYNYNAHFINFWRWLDASGTSNIKGKNKEIALRHFIQLIRDKARKRDLSFVFTPPQVIELSGKFLEKEAAVELQVSGRIWEGLSWEWKKWGDFSHFEVFRSAKPGFEADSSTFLLKSSEYIFKDSTISGDQTYYYKVRAVNSKGVAGPLSPEIQVQISMLYPPLNFQGKRVINRSLFFIEHIIVLTWEPNPANREIAGYRIYEVEGDKRRLLAQLNSGTLKFRIRLASENKTYTLALTVFDFMNRESAPAVISVK